MKNKILFLLSLLIYACSFQGYKLKHFSEDCLHYKIVIGETTIDEVFTLLGKPNKTNFDLSGNRVLSYTFVESVGRTKKDISKGIFDSSFRNYRNLLILIDDHGIVCDKMIQKRR